MIPYENQTNNVKITSKTRSSKNVIQPLLDPKSPLSNTRFAAAGKDGSIRSLLESNLSKEDQIDILESANIAISIA
jgi:hypothetical protein